MRHGFKNGVLNTLCIALHPHQLMGTPVGGRLLLFVDQEEDQGQTEDAHNAGSSCQGCRSGIFTFLGGGWVQYAFGEWGLAFLHLELHNTVDHLLRVMVVKFHHQTAVDATVLHSQVEQGDREVPVVVGAQLHSMVQSEVLVPSRILAAVGVVMPAMVRVQLSICNIADGPSL